MKKVISLDKDRVVIKNDVVTKKTTHKEYNCLLTAKKIIDEQVVIIDDKVYYLKVPNVYKYEDGKIYMQKCHGKNLEIILRDGKTHKFGVHMTNQLLQQFITTNFFWKDFAPRNILVDKNTISIFDFERGIAPVGIFISDYFFENVFEEYTAFLLPNERVFAFEEVFHRIDKKINFEDIKSKRVKMLVEKLGGHNNDNTVDFPICLKALKMIIDQETPYFNGKRNVYPIVYLENYLYKYGYEKYCEKIMRKTNEHNRKI